MNNFEFYSPTDFVFGRDAELRAGDLVKRFGGSRVLLVYGGGHAVRSGLIDRVKQSLTEASVGLTELSGVMPNPTDEIVYLKCCGIWE